MPGCGSRFDTGEGVVPCRLGTAHDEDVMHTARRADQTYWWRTDQEKKR